MKAFKILSLVVGVVLITALYSCKSSGETTRSREASTKQMTATNMLELLKMQPNLQVYGSGGNVRMQIRGQRSLNASGEPLIILNGYRVGTGYDLISNLNPGDVDRIRIVTDPADLSAYGLGAANGVIDITMKK